MFEQLFRCYLQPLLEFARYYVMNEQEAENVVQDAFLYLWTHREVFKPEINIKAYLYRTVKNKSLNYRRHQKIEKNYADSFIYIPDTLEMPDAHVRQSDLENALEKAIQALPEKRRVIFCMHRFENLSYEEIAQILEISIKTVETQIRRSLLFLEKQLSHFLHTILL